MRRRRFVIGTMSLPAAALLGACGGGDGDKAVTTTARTGATSAGGTGSWPEVRALFDLDPEVQHLSAYILAPHSRPVREAIVRHRDGLDAEPRGYLLENEHLEDDAAEAAARHLGSKAGLVALTDSATMGLGLVFGGLGLSGGDEIVVTEHEHIVARRSAYYADDRTGATVRQIELYPPRAPERATIAGVVSAYREAISPATRVVVATWVHSSSGLRMPLREIADVVERANRGRAEEDRILLVVDAAHALGGGPAPVEELGCDFLIASGHKWLMGPRGTGIVWGSETAWRRVAPIIPSFRIDSEDEPPGVVMTPGGYHSFEHRWALVDAFKLHEEIGARRIAGRVAELGDALRDGLAGLRGVTVHQSRERQMRSGVVAFTVAGLDGPETVGRLFDQGKVHASVGPYDPQLARLGTSWINTEDEVEAAIRAVEAIRG